MHSPTTACAQLLTGVGLFRASRLTCLMQGITIIPWSLACSVPLSFIGVGPACLPFAFFIYLTPLCNCIRHRMK